MRKEFKKIKLLFRGHVCILIIEYKYGSNIGSQGKTYFYFEDKWNAMCKQKHIKFVNITLTAISLYTKHICLIKR